MKGVCAAGGKVRGYLPMDEEGVGGTFEASLEEETVRELQQRKQEPPNAVASKGPTSTAAKAHALVSSVLRAQSERIVHLSRSLQSDPNRIPIGSQ